MANNDRWTTVGPLETNEDSEGLNHWKSLALKHWSKSKKVKKVDPGVIKTEIWDVLQASSFEFRSLLDLDNLQLLEKYILHGAFRRAGTHLLQILMARIQRRGDKLSHSPDRSNYNGEKSRESPDLE